MSEALWAFGRGTGTVALVMFTVSLVVGILTRSGRTVPGLSRFAVADLHRTAALMGTLLVVAHVVSLYADPYAQLRLVDVVVPFLGANQPLWLGLGTVALDTLLVVTIVSLLRHRVGPRVFRAVHWATYALWPIAFLHGIENGSDAGTAWFVAVAVACAVTVAGAIAWRLAPSYADRGRLRTPRKVAS
jgi:predicted ferric reductase